MSEATLQETVQSMKQVMQEADCLCTPEEVNAAYDRMAAAISERLGDTLPLVYCVMNGGLITTAQLLTRLDFPLEVDYIHATRYRRAVSGGELHWRVAPEVSMQGRTLLIVDDILDEGATLAAIKDYCVQEGAQAVYTAVLVDKQHNRKARPDLQADFVGLQVEDRYLFGCGMDYKGYLRNLPGIYAPKGL
ncbi:hypoxanthine phosphoribosyltransferase [Allopseudospirillum japonicum]|uniref:Hypoxanthine phosphoribosyltransferase n=1 Tax=Allopseudospirillum japonicum TaxID=64971 RepID=A0A1H6S793_9GAMM|nr:hypoxanthine-guanine phosphoribosyltransferase [Allopseudospirillum japonicum]SEI59890.1 hypoxanthine phosphoribosyltransferase [Allopseudospirillum japonicum]